MILRRQGNKSKIAQEIQLYFPKHKVYIEPFFGAGGMFFNKPKAKYNFVNDLDNDVFNLFNIVSTRYGEFVAMFEQMPIHEGLLNYWGGGGSRNRSYFKSTTFRVFIKLHAIWIWQYIAFL